MTEALATFAPWLAVFAVGLLIGVAVGYYAASTDLEEDRARTRSEGFVAGLRAAEDMARGTQIYDQDDDWEGQR